MKKAHWIVALIVVMSLMGMVLAGCGGTTTTTAASTTSGTGEQSTTTGSETSTTVGQPVELSMAFFASDTSFPAKASHWWIDELEKATNGQVKVKFFPGGTLLTSQNMFDGVLQGVADIGVGGATYEPGRFPLISINDLPGLYVTAKQASASIYDVLMANQDIAELKDYHLVTTFTMEPGYLMTIKKYETLESLKGAEIRTPGGPKVLEALGAVGVGMPQSEVAQALQTNVIQGVYSSREVLYDFKYAEKCKYIIDYPLGQVTFLAVMTKDKYNSLPDNVKKAIDDLSKPFSEKAAEIMDTTAVEALEWGIAEQGMEVVKLSDAEKAKFDAALSPLRETWLAEIAAKGLPAEDFYKQLEQAAAKYK